MNNIVLLGPPGAGKGTLSVLLAKTLGLPHISTGDIFRAEIAAGTPIGLTAKSYMDQGMLVPDHVTNRMLAGRLTQPDCANGFILDGFPRSEDQARVLDQMLDHWQQKVKAAVLIEVSDEIIIQRLSRRHVCTFCGLNYNLDPAKVLAEKTKCKVCGASLERRNDDTMEAIKNRLRIYGDLSKPLIEYYEQQGKLHRFVNANRSLGETCRLILTSLGEKVPDELPVV